MSYERQPEDDVSVENRKPGMPDSGRLDASASHALFTGTLSFPFYLRSLAATLPLSVVGILSVGLPVAMWLQHVDEGTIILRIVMALSGFAVLFAIWLMWASAFGLTILQETSRGAETIEQWPQWSLFEWVYDGFFVVWSLAISAVVGLPVNLLFNNLEISSFMGFVLIVPLAYPVVLLSMQETNSPFNPISLPVWRSVLSCGRAWGLFYLLSYIIGVVVVVASRAASLGGRTTCMIVTGTVVAVAWIVYFRLLGRLAWYCAEHSAVDDSQEEEEDEIEEEEELIIPEE